jgi:hypothetical protein
VKRFGEYKKGYDLCSPKREGLVLRGYRGWDNITNELLEG